MWPLCIAFEQLFEIPLLMDFSCSEFPYLVRKDSFLLKSFEQAWLEMGQVLTPPQLLRCLLRGAGWQQLFATYLLMDFSCAEFPYLVLKFCGPPGLMVSFEKPRDRYSLQKVHYNYYQVVRDCEMNRYWELLRGMFQNIYHVEINKRYDNLRFFDMCEMWNKL